MPRMYLITVQSMNKVRAEATDGDDELMNVVIAGTFVSPLDPTTNTGDPVSIGNTINTLARGIDKALLDMPVSEIRAMTVDEVRKYRDDEGEDRAVIDKLRGNTTVDLVGGKAASDNEEG